MGFLVVTDRRLVLGMSWAFFPFISRRIGIPLERITSTRVESKPWGGRLVVGSTMGRVALGNLEEAEGERLAALITELAGRARLSADPPARTD